MVEEYILTNELIKSILKSKYEHYKNLEKFIKNNYHIHGESKYSKKNGWTIFFRKSGKSLCYVNLENGMFITTVVIGSSLSEDLKKLPLSKESLAMFDNAKAFHDGKWLFFDKNTNKEIEDIKTLMHLKRKPFRK